VLIVQHMPAPFTGAFAARLARQCSVAVKEAEPGDRIEDDRILIAPGGRHMLASARGPLARVALDDGPPVSGHRPSIDVLFRSVAHAYGPSAVGLLMTGMGRDGVDGCKALLLAGGLTLAQDEATSVVYGMNKAAVQENAASHQFPLEELPRLLESFRRGR
jgi:two-component system chemotaxis response regulator CheB